MLMLDDIDDDLRDRVYRQICGVRWQFGWKSNRATDTYCFLHQHYAGHINPDHEGAKPYDCESELLGANQVLVELWDALKDKCERLRAHRLIRCYANGYPYGTDGTVHTDTVNPLGLTTIFYPHPVWNPDWGGETVFFTSDLSDTTDIAYPKPGRVIIFHGKIPHVARGVSRSCPIMRMTLMFKSEPMT